MWRAILIGKLMGQKICFDERTQRDIDAIVKMLDGTFDPDKDMPKRRGMPPAGQMKNLW